jgi:hypothetical protein
MQSWVQIGRNPASALAKISPHIGSVVSIELSKPNQTLPAFLALNGQTMAGSGLSAVRKFALPADRRRWIAQHDAPRRNRAFRCPLRIARAT